MGRQAAIQLRKNPSNDVFEITRTKSFWKQKETDRVDLLSYESVENLISTYKFSHVYHFAGASSVVNSWNNPLDTIKYNAGITKNLVESIGQCSGDTKLVLISSSAVYARSEDPLSESSDLGPDSPYGMSKLVSEYEVSKLPNSLIIRPFFVIGPNKRNDVLDDWIGQLKSFSGVQNHELRVGNLKIIRDFISVETATKLTLELSESSKGVFNLGSGNGTPLQAVVDILKSISGYNFKVLENSMEKSRLADRLKVTADISKLSSAVKQWNEPSLTEQIERIYKEFKRD